MISKLLTINNFTNRLCAATKYTVSKKYKKAQNIRLNKRFFKAVKAFMTCPTNPLFTTTKCGKITINTECNITPMNTKMMNIMGKILANSIMYGQTIDISFDNTFVKSFLNLTIDPSECENKDMKCFETMMKSFTQGFNAIMNINNIIELMTVEDFNCLTMNTKC